MVAALSLKEQKSDVVNQAINQLQQGRDNASGIATLIAGTSTTIANPNCSPTSGVQLTPSSSNAVTAAAWVSAVSKGQFTITHSSGFTGATFFYRVHGGN